MSLYWARARWCGFAALAVVTWSMGGGACASVPDEEPSGPPQVGGDAADAGTDASNDHASSTGAYEWSLVEFSQTSQTLSGIWGSGPNDVWAVGSHGTILHWDGSRWDTSETGTRVALRAVWGSGPEDVWATGTMEDIFHSSGWQDGGSRWALASGVDGGLADYQNDNSTAANMIAPSIWGSSAADVWLTSLSRYKNGWHCDGWARGNVSWQNVLVYPQYGSAIWGSDAENVWVVGQYGKIARSGGYKEGFADWVPVNSGTRANLNAIWGTYEDDVWVVGDNGVIRHWTYDDVDMLRWNPSSSGTEQDLFAVWGSSATDIWVAGEETILHGDGSSWSASSFPSVPPMTRFFGIWGSGPDDVWIVGDHVILHRSGPVGGGR